MSETVLSAQTEEAGLMKAIVHTKYGSPDVLQLQEVKKPVPDEIRGVLVKVYASSMNPADRYQIIAPLMVRLMARSGLRRPKDPKVGSDVSGRVEAVNDKVTQFKPGDEVFGVCPGACAEYATAKESRLALKPVNCSFEEAAAAGIAGITALQALRDQGEIKPAQKVLVNGAGGGVGTFAVQIAKAYGAEVTAVTRPDNLAMVRSLGADHVIDYTREDFAKNGQRYDLICDIASSHSIGEYRRSLNPGGICVTVGFRNRVFARLLYYALLGRLSRSKKFRFFIAKTNQEDFVFLKGLIEAGKLRTVIDRSYPLSRTAEAVRYLGEGNARGKIIISVVDSQTEPMSQSKKALPVAA